MPVINTPGMIGRWFIDNGMRRGIPSVETRAHVWTAYTDRDALTRACGMPTTKNVYAMVVERDGAILAMETGDYTQQGAANLLKAINQPVISTL